MTTDVHVPRVIMSCGSFGRGTSGHLWSRFHPACRALGGQVVLVGNTVYDLDGYDARSRPWSLMTQTIGLGRYVGSFGQADDWKLPAHKRQRTKPGEPSPLILGLLQKL